MSALAVVALLLLGAITVAFLLALYLEDHYTTREVESGDDG